MKAEIIAIGDELLIGQVVNSNASFIASELTKIGFQVTAIQAIPDNKQRIMEALDSAFAGNDLIITTGGLGPTKDDITKHTLCEYFNTTLELNQDALKVLSDMLSRRNLPLSETNRQQAFLPLTCSMLPNYWGTAPGMWFEKDKKFLVSLPGVPFEMENLIVKEVIPRLSGLPSEDILLHKTLLVAGIPEAALSDKLENFEASLPSSLSLAYLPNLGMIRLRLTAKGENKEIAAETLNNAFEKLAEEVKDHLIAKEDNTLEQIAGDLLKKQKITIATAESCTGGFVAHLLTSVPGASLYFRGGLVAYNNEIKQEILHVRKEVLKKFGAVSESTASQMALNAMQMFDTEFAIATTGIAGPSGGSPEKPVGTVWIALATPAKVVAKEFHFSGSRKIIIQRASISALTMLVTELLSMEAK